jgi:hypothetical protein
MEDESKAAPRSLLEPPLARRAAARRDAVKSIYSHAQ